MRQLCGSGPRRFLKTAGFGYDGKGQVKISSVEEVEEAWMKLNTDEAVLEGFISFDKELSVVTAQNIDGDFVPFDVFQNRHANHILDLTICPADISPKTALEAKDRPWNHGKARCRRCSVRRILVASGDRLIVNELAPRPHNSGHLTIDACITCQFEQRLELLRFAARVHGSPPPCGHVEPVGGSLGTGAA